jgi:hypothetical protein
MYFDTKRYLKSNYCHTDKHPFTYINTLITRLTCKITQGYGT